jgi:hypothetical protein
MKHWMRSFRSACLAAAFTAAAPEVLRAQTPEPLNWTAQQDHKNMMEQLGGYMATVAAGPVFRLLGARDIGEKENYRTAKMPPVNTGLLDGELAWRQHDGGHEDRSNMKHFIAWASKLLKHTPPATTPLK